MLKSFFFKIDYRMCKIIFLGYHYDSVVGMADSIGSVPWPVASQPARRLCLTAAQAKID